MDSIRIDSDEVPTLVVTVPDTGEASAATDDGATMALRLVQRHAPPKEVSVHVQ